MPRNNHNNIRREFKHLWKNWKRGQINSDYIHNWLRERGLWGDLNWINLILLKTNIPSRVISRVGKAAKKRGGYVKLSDLYYVWVIKDEDREFLPANLACDYHLIEFFQVKSYIEEKSEVKITHYLQFETLLGESIGQPQYNCVAPECFSSVKISEEKYL